MPAVFELMQGCLQAEKEPLSVFRILNALSPRVVQTIPYKLSASEKMLYEAVTEYVRNNFEKAERMQNERVAISLALISDSFEEITTSMIYDNFL